MNLLRTSSQISIFRSVIVYFLVYCMFFNASLPVVLAGPEGAQVVNGNVTINQSGYNTTITASDKAIINYSSFDISRPEIVQFIQPGTNASVLNRILSANPTNINGTLLANGRVFFVNPAGVYFGNGAQVNVNQLVASALDITDADFINGRYNFAGGEGSVINAGDICAEKVYLIGKQVANSGSISCPAGFVVMASGDRVFLGEPGSDIVLEIDGPFLPESADPVEGSGVLNEGTVEAAGGTIVLAAAGDIYSQAISNVGSLSVSNEAGGAGQIKLSAADGVVTNTGAIDASGSEGGQITMEGTKVGQFGTIHADGTDSHGGSVDLTASEVVALSSESLTTANAGLNGDGGDVVVYSPSAALFHEGAQIEAKGGSESGDGGFVEVSGKEYMLFQGHVDASAVGENGVLLIDPTSLEIKAAGASPADWQDHGDGFYYDQDDQSILDPADIVTELASQNVLLLADDLITVTDPITYNQPQHLKLETVNAGSSIVVNDAITNSGTGDVTLYVGVDGWIDLNANISLNGGTLSGNAATVNVLSDSASIQNGIDVAAAGATVTVSDGTYTEDLTVDKSNLTLMSVNGRDSTIIQLVDGVGINIGAGGSGFLLGGDVDADPDNGVDNGFEITSGGATTFDIQLENAPSDVEISWNTINTTGNASMGISVGAAGATGLNVNNNNFTAGDLGDGSIWGPDMVDVSVTENTFTGPAVHAGSGYAVEFAGVTGTSLIQDNVISNYGMGIAIFNGTGTSGLTISGNQVSNCTNGIRLGQYSPSVNGDMTTVTVTENTLSNNTIGLRINDGANVKASNFTIQHNSFSGNTTGLANQHTSESVAAAENYWGDVDGPDGIGPGSGDPITEVVADSVDYSPWWGGDYIGDSHVTSWIWGTDDSIQDAIDLASTTVSDKIYITSGIYTETVNVNKQLDGLYFRGDGTVASEIDGTLTLSDAVASNTGVDISTQNGGDLTLNTVSDAGIHSLLVNTGDGTLSLDENVTANGGVTLDGGIINVGNDAGDKITSAGAVSITGSGTVTIEAAIDPATVTITSEADASVNINNSVTADTQITVTADDDVTFNASGDLSTTSGSITVTADADGDDNGAGGAITMADGTVIDAGSGTITLSADEDIAIGRLVTTNNTAAAVSITSTSGAVTDAGDIGGADIEATDAGAIVTIDAVTGVGSGDAIETEVTTIDIDNSTSGNVEIDETDALNINKIVQATAGNIDVVAGGTITVVAAQSGVSAVGAGTIDLDADGTGSDLVVNDGVSSAGGKIALEADNDVTFGADGDVTSVSGNVEVTADKDGVADGSSGALTMVDGTVIDAGSGTITLSADEDIAIGRLVTTNNTATAISITSTSGAVTDAGDTGGADIEATGANATVTISAVTGIGTGGAIDTAASKIAASTMGNAAHIDIDNASGSATELTSVSTTGTGANITFDQTGGGDLTLTSVTTTDGTIDVSADSGNITATLVTAGTSGDILLDTTTSGDITLGSLTATGDKITINSAGMIDDAAIDAVADLTADELDLDAADGIGTGAEIETVATSISADTTNGDIDLDNTNASATAVSSLTTGTGNIDFGQTGGGALTLTTATTTTGNIDIDAASGIQIGGSVAAGGAYDITASGGDVIFAANGKVTGSATSSIEATTGSIANTGSDEATTIETTGAGSNLTLTAANAATQSTKPMTVVSSSDLTLNAPLDNTSSTTTLSSADNLAINNNITDAATISVHSGTDGTGDVTFGGGVTLDAPTISLRSGDGPGGAANAEVDIMTNTPTIVADTLTIRQDGQMGTKDDPMTVPNEDDPWNPNVTNNASIDLTLLSDESSIYTTDADSWQSITAEAKDNIELSGSGDIKIATTGLLSHEGGVKVVSNGGSIYTPGAGGALNAPITGYSDESADVGVDLPYAYISWPPPLDPGKKAAIVIWSQNEDLKLGPDAILTAYGAYDPTQFDDRLSFLVDISTPIEFRGDPVDVAIYLGSSYILGDDSVDMGSSSVWIENKSLTGIGTLAIDADDTVTFTDAFENSLPGSTVRRLEVVSRISPDLDTAIADETLPYADNPSLLADGLYFGTYVLRGNLWLENQVLQKREEAPIVPPKLEEPEEQGAVEEPDMDALRALLMELGIGVQPYLARAYPPSLNTDLRLFKAAEKLQNLIPMLEDAEGRRIAALRVVVGQFFPTLASISDEQMASFCQEVARHVGDGTDYDLAGQTIASLTDYVEILSTDIGWPTDRSMAFVMGRYIPRLTEGDAIRTAVVQIQLQEALGM